MKLELITSFYNPMNYRNLRNNYWKFRQELNHDLTTVELSFNGKFEIDDAIQIRGSSNSIMFQKECLLNIAMERSDADAVAWVDCDLIWKNPNWIEETIQKLHSFPVVQLFQNCTDLHANGEEFRTLPGHVWGEFRDIGTWKRPGGAWACRKEILDEVGGLNDSQILGGGDCLMLSAFQGNWKHSIVKYMTEAWRLHHMRYAAKLYPLVRNKLGYVTGNVDHLYHGSLQNRDYTNRWKRLTDYDYDPSEDIIKDHNGLWKWNSEKPEMQQRVRDYFRDRREDD